MEETVIEDSNTDSRISESSAPDSVAHESVVVTESVPDLEPVTTSESAPDREPAGHVHHYVAEQRILSDAYEETITVTDQEAWEELVLVEDQAAWDEAVTVIDSEAWEEVMSIVDQPEWEETITVVDTEAYDYVSQEISGYRCRCGAFFSTADDGVDGSIAVNAHQRAMTEQIDAKYQAIIDSGQWKEEMLHEWDQEIAVHGGYADSREYVYTHVDAVVHEEKAYHEAISHIECIHHEPLTHTEVIYHPAETHTEIVHHEPVYETIYVCTECGMVKE